jgi:hypothetical protein
LATGRPDGFEPLAVGVVAAEELVAAAGASGDGGGGLVLVSAGTGSLTVGWSAGFAAGSAGYLLRFRLDHVAEDVKPKVWQVGIDAGARSYEVLGLKPATRYRFELVPLDVDGTEGEPATGTFATLAPPVRNLSARVAAPDAVQLRWDGPPGWSPVGYAVQWRRRGVGAFEGRLEAPAGRRELTVTALAGGVDYEFRVTARTAGGWQSQPLAVAVATPAAPETTLRLEVSAPFHCIASEGLIVSSEGSGEDLVWERGHVDSVEVQWRVSGGQAPYVVRVGGFETSAASGTTDVTCARAGIDLKRLTDPDVNVIEPGPKTITLEATDAAGATITRTHVVEINPLMRRAESFWAGGSFEPGRTFYGFGRFFETPEGEEFAFESRALADTFEGNPTMLAYFRRVVDGDRHTTAAIDLSTGDRVGVWVSNREGTDAWDQDYGELPSPEELAAWDRFFAGMRSTPFPPGDLRNEPPAPLAPDAGGAVSGQQHIEPEPCKYLDGRDVDLGPAHLWRPFGQRQLSTGEKAIPCWTSVLAHPRLLGGRTITVCVAGPIHDSRFDPPTAFGEALAAAVRDWNTSLAGLGRSVFVFNAAEPSCPPNLKIDHVGYVRVFDRRSCHFVTVFRACPENFAGLANTVTREDDGPPRVSGNSMEVFTAYGRNPTEKLEQLKQVFRHELGHFLGLVDYPYGCWRLVDSGGNVQPSLMSAGQLLDDDGNPVTFTDGTKDPAGCWSPTITSRDLADLHAMYHPQAVTGLALRQDAGAAAVLSWTLPAETRTTTPLSYNAVSLGVYWRSPLSRDPDTGAPAGPGPWALLARLPVASNRHVLGVSPGGWEYAVAGLTGGDHRPAGEADPLGLRHTRVIVSDARHPRLHLTAGEPSGVVSLPPPTGVYPLGFDGFGQVHFGETGAGKWRFSVYSRARRVSGIPIDAGDLLIAYQPKNASDPDPFDAAGFVPVTIRYGTDTVTIAGCRTRSAGTVGGLHLCHVDDTNFSVDPADVPLRLVVTTTAGTTGTSVPAATYPVDRNIAGFVNYGGSGPGQWRFAFWGRTLLGLRVGHGGPVNLRPGDVVISHSEPYGRNGLADSPFAAARFRPLRITYGATTIDVTRCATHFYNVDRYECHIAGAFTFNGAAIPADVTVEHHPTATRAVGGAAAPPETLKGAAAPLPATCTTVDLDCLQRQQDE